ncbi:MAG: PD-(D/E)XK nuclease-like domain-containing protein [Enterovibrio sp.]
MRLIRGLSNDEYRAAHGWSKSDLDLLAKSPCLVEWSRNAPRGSSDSVDLGTHLHCLILEPERFAVDYVAAPKFDLRTKAGKAEAEMFHSASEDGGKIVLDAETADTLQAMLGSVKAHPAARNLLFEAAGESEVSIFSEISGVKVKCRPDRMLKSPVLVDVKKTADIETFAKSIRQFRYDVQAAFYSDIAARFYGVLPEFYLVAVGEKRQIGRHPVRVFKLPSEKVEYAREKYLRDLELAKEVDVFGAGFHVETIDF